MWQDPLWAALLPLNLRAFSGLAQPEWALQDKVRSSNKSISSSSRMSSELKAEDSVWWRRIPPTRSTRMVFPSRESASLIPLQGNTGGNIFSQITSVFGESQKHSTVHVWRWVSQETQDFYLRWVTLVIIILSMLWFYYVFNLIILCESVYAFKSPETNV